MKIAIVADKKSGDLSHCLGLRDVLQDYDPKKDIFYLHKDLISFPGFFERSLRLINEKFLLKLEYDSTVIPGKIGYKEAEQDFNVLKSNMCI